MIVTVCARLQELIELRNLEQKHEPMKSLLLDIDFRSVCVIFFIVDHDVSYCTAALIYWYLYTAHIIISKTFRGHITVSGV